VAIKPITNENAGYESNINRAEQKSIRSEKGNPKVVIKKPGGQNAGKGFSIGLKEIDTAVIKHIRNIMKPKVKEQNEIISVPVLYGNEERWKSIKDRGTLRDKMNDLNSLWIEHLETYFGDQTSYRFLSSLDGDISNEIEMESQGERMIRNEFSMTVKGYMIPEFTDNVFGKTAELGRAYTPKKVTFSEKLL
jgi:hypothetical protein